MSYEPQKVTNGTQQTCEFCGEQFKGEHTEKYCSMSCGYKDKLCNEWHCPVCNDLVYNRSHDPYCSQEHRKEHVDNYNHKRQCIECSAVFFADKFTYLCSDYCDFNHEPEVQPNE